MEDWGVRQEVSETKIEKESANFNSVMKRKKNANFADKKGYKLNHGLAMLQVVRVQNIEGQGRHEYPCVGANNMEDCLSGLRSDILSGNAFFFGACCKTEKAS